jgi:hypothetical protein
LPCERRLTEASEIIAAQNQSLNTQYYAMKIVKISDDSKCRMYQQFDESVEYLIAGYAYLAKEECVKHHGRVSTQLHLNVCKQVGKKVTFQVLAATSMNMAVFWKVAPCSLVDIN